MPYRILTLVKPLALSVFALALFTLGQSEARADEVFVAGYTNGCFNCVAPAPAANSGTQTANLFGLTYTNSQFSGTSAGGFLGIGDNPSPPGVQGTNNLGSFTLSTAPNTYNGNTFTLRVTFTAPQGIVPPGAETQTFTAVLTGTVSNVGGGVRIDFNNTPITFTFNDTNCGATTVPGQQTTCGSGSFTLQINDVSIFRGGTVALTGDILGAQQAIPEPATMILLGTGLTGVAAAARRRRRASRK